MELHYINKEFPMCPYCGLRKVNTEGPKSILETTNGHEQSFKLPNVN